MGKRYINIAFEKYVDERMDPTDKEAVYSILDYSPKNLSETAVEDIAESAEEVYENCRFSAEVSFGGSEGIYLDLALTDVQAKRTFKIGTYKTLETGLDAMKKMHLLAAYIDFYYDDFMRELCNTDNPTKGRKK